MAVVYGTVVVPGFVVSGEARKWAVAERRRRSPLTKRANELWPRALVAGFVAYIVWAAAFLPCMLIRCDEKHVHTDGSCDYAATVGAVVSGAVASVMTLFCIESCVYAVYHHWLERKEFEASAATEEETKKLIV